MTVPNKSLLEKSVPMRQGRVKEFHTISAGKLPSLSNNIRDSPTYLNEKKGSRLSNLVRAGHGRESAKDFIRASNDIFRANMAIMNKDEESQKLKEYLVMEQERLDEARQQFQDDVSKYNKYLKDLQDKTMQITYELE